MTKGGEGMGGIKLRSDYCIVSSLQNTRFLDGKFLFTVNVGEDRLPSFDAAKIRNGATRVVTVRYRRAIPWPPTGGVGGSTSTGVQLCSRYCRFRSSLLLAQVSPRGN